MTSGAFYAQDDTLSDITRGIYVYKTNEYLQI